MNSSFHAWARWWATQSSWTVSTRILRHGRAELHVWRPSLNAHGLIAGLRLCPNAWLPDEWLPNAWWSDLCPTHVSMTCPNSYAMACRVLALCVSHSCPNYMPNACMKHVYSACRSACVYSALKHVYWACMRHASSNAVAGFSPACLAEKGCKYQKMLAVNDQNVSQRM